MKKERVAIYTRVSPKPKEKNERSTSLDNQKEIVEKYAEARGWSHTQLYQDEMYSGRNEGRPALKLLLEDARKRRIDIIIVYKLDRFFRSLKHMINTMQELEEIGVKFISVKENIDFSTSAGRLMFHIISAMAEFEADIIKERTQDTIAARKERGEGWGRPVKLNHDKIIDLYDQGLSYNQVAKKIGCSKAGIAKIIQKRNRKKALSS